MSLIISADQKLISNESPLQLLPQLTLVLGRSEAMIIQQLHYRLQMSKNYIDGVPWVYKTYREWFEELICLSDSTIRRAIYKLEKLGVIKSERLDAHYWNQRKWYTICYDALQTYVSEIWSKKAAKLGLSQQLHLGELDKFKTKNTQKNLKTTDTVPTHHPVQKINREGILDETEPPRVDACETDLKLNTSIEEKSDQSQTIENPPQFSKEIKIDLQLEQEVKEAIAPCPLNAQLKRVVMEAGAELVTNALGIVKHTRKKGKVKNPAGLLRKAIEQQWTPNYQPDEPTPSPGFNTWYEAARNAGIVMSSQWLDGKQWVYDRNAQPFLYDEMLQRYPLASLQAQPAKVSKPSLPQLPVDLSDVLTSIDLQCVRLGWAKEQVGDFLKQTYGTCRRALLDDDQILDLNSRLKAL